MEEYAQLKEKKRINPIVTSVVGRGEVWFVLNRWFFGWTLSEHGFSAHEMQGIPRRPVRARKTLPPPPPIFYHCRSILVLLRHLRDLQGCRRGSLSVLGVAGIQLCARSGRAGVLGGRLCLSFSAFSESLSTRVYRCFWQRTLNLTLPTFLFFLIRAAVREGKVRDVAPRQGAIPRGRILSSSRVGKNVQEASFRRQISMNWNTD